jgi:ribosomal protein L34E
MNIHKCGNCGNPIQDAFRPDGSLVPAGDVAFNAIQRWGVPYCADCQNKLQNMRGNQR